MTFSTLCIVIIIKTAFSKWQTDTTDITRDRARQPTTPRGLLSLSTSQDSVTPPHTSTIPLRYMLFLPLVENSMFLQVTHEAAALPIVLREPLLQRTKLQQSPLHEIVAAVRAGDEVLRLRPTTDRLSSPQSGINQSSIVLDHRVP